MDGYEECNWDTLQAVMVETWGAFDDDLMYTMEDLYEVAEQQSRRGIIMYEDPGMVFLSPFSRESQGNIKQTLFNSGKIPKGRDGNFKAPKWDHLVAAAEMEMVRIEEGYVEENNRAWELASLKPRLEVTSTGTCKYPQPSNQLEFPEGTITDNTEPDIDCAEPPMDCVDAIMDVMEPVVEIEETYLKNYSQESVLETAASTIQLLYMATNQKPSTAYFMDKEMELKHTVIEISDFGLDSVDSTISVGMTTSMDEEEILDQSIQQNQT
ncbi:hypothetical protein PTTG_30261, partial [Puccinia triticina 1-1 BBBD Race 1]